MLKPGSPESCKLQNSTNLLPDLILLQMLSCLSLPVSAQATPPSIEGTGGFFVSDSCQPGKFFLVTARHIIFPPGQDSSEFYQYINSSQCRYNVLLMGNK